MKVTKRQIRQIIKETMDEAAHDDVPMKMSAETLRDTASDRIEAILNSLYDDLIEDAMLSPMEAQEHVESLAEATFKATKDGYVGMPT